MSERLLEIPLFINYYFNIYAKSTQINEIPEKFFKYTIDQVKRNKVSNIQQIEYAIRDAITLSNNKESLFEIYQQKLIPLKTYAEDYEDNDRILAQKMLNKEPPIVSDNKKGSTIVSLCDKFQKKEMILERNWRKFAETYGKNTLILLVASVWLDHMTFSKAADFLGVASDAKEIFRQYVMNLKYVFIENEKPDGENYNEFKNGGQYELPLRYKNLYLFKPFLIKEGLSDFR